MGNQEDPDGLESEDCLALQVLKVQLACLDSLVSKDIEALMDEMEKKVIKVLLD